MSGIDDTFFFTKRCNTSMNGVNFDIANTLSNSPNPKFASVFLEKFSFLETTETRYLFIYN